MPRDVRLYPKLEARADLATIVENMGLNQADYEQVLLLMNGAYDAGQVDQIREDQARAKK